MYTKIRQAQMAGVLTAACLLAAGTAPADVIHVPDDYPTIMEALDAATDGDEIIVAPGTYYEKKIKFAGKAVTLRSADGPEVTTIDNSGNGSVVVCNSGEGPDTILDGFTITGGAGTYKGGGMDNSAAHPTVANCIFINNGATDRGGGMSNTSASPTVINCQFIDNSAPDGGGMCNWYDSHPLISGCSFQANSASEGGALNSSHESDTTLTDCAFLENYASYRGGALYCVGSSPVMTGCLFEANSATVSSEVGGGGAIFCEIGDPVLTDCHFIGNSTASWAGAFNYVTAAPLMTDCQFIGNEANKGGALGYSYGEPLYVNCLFAGNHADTWAGAISSHRSAPTFINCTLAYNHAPEIGGIRINQNPADGGTTFVNAVLWGNTDDSGSLRHAQIGLQDADPDLLSVDYSCVQAWDELVDGEGIIDADPLFLAPNSGDFHLADLSPAIDAGNNLALPDELEFDLDGNPRLVDNPDVDDTGIMSFGDPGVVDMGCYEWQTPACFGDIDEDGFVDVVDLLILLATWGECSDPGHCFGDLDGSGTVDVIDLLLLLNAWGPCE